MGTVKNGLALLNSGVIVCGGGSISIGVPRMGGVEVLHCVAALWSLKSDVDCNSMRWNWLRELGRVAGVRHGLAAVGESRATGVAGVSIFRMKMGCGCDSVGCCRLSLVRCHWSVGGEGADQLPVGNRQQVVGNKVRWDRRRVRKTLALYYMGAKLHFCMEVIRGSGVRDL